MPFLMIGALLWYADCPYAGAAFMVAGLFASVVPAARKPPRSP